MKKNTILYLAGCFVAITVLVFFLRPWLSKNNQSKLPEGWKYQESQVCQIEVPLPPKEKPYLGSNGEYWNFEEQNQNQVGIFNTTAIAIFKNPTEKSSTIAAAVLMSCAQNTSNDSAKSLIEKYQEYLNFQNQGIVENAKLMVTIIREEKIWGKDALVVTFSGEKFNPNEEFYVVTTKKTVYLISKVEDSQDPFLRQTADNIFAGLSFK